MPVSTKHLIVAVLCALQGKLKQATRLNYAILNDVRIPCNMKGWAKPYQKRNMTL